MTETRQNKEELFSKLPQWLNYDQSDNMEEPMDVTITGNIPKWINGSVYRNGSGLYKIGPTTWNHVFDGFAVIQRWTFKDGKVTYQSSILDSDDYKKSAKLNRIVGMGFGKTFPDPCKTIFGRLFSKFMPARPETVHNTAVNIVEFGDRLFALTETPLINEVASDTLKVNGKSIMPDYVAVHLGTGHPHKLKDGTMIYFGTHCNYMQAYNFISIPPQPVTSDSPFSGAKIVATAPSRYKTNISYTHSFGITENYFIHLEQPLTFSIPKLLMSALTSSSLSECFITDKVASLDFMVVDPKTRTRTPINYKAANGFIFHFINCYEDSDHIVCDTSYYPSGAEFIKSKYLEHLSKISIKNFTCNDKVYFARFVLPLHIEGAQEGQNLVTLPNTTATAVLEKGSKTTLLITPETFEGNHMVELPQINYDYNARKYRYFYGSAAFIQNKKQLSKFDLFEKRVLTFEVNENITPGEPIFVARPGATKEDDGVILCNLVANTPDDHSSLVVLDAETFQEIGRATLPKEVRMSYTFHGNFTNKLI
ncbi:beta,beta-carotene 15,15'-monooxygenase [Plakobranchus ocellatus]|uniref:Beta,beta-carotene 15,15'-monooxygenase n=1 Tax=Plakobranchus ocellatus TaxID=259542 RepID=A0AAV4DA42_9GAST|nr:beta,beta-carotene 15,15'-monooxygenase [Plakobranchus ocellatus]